MSTYEITEPAEGEVDTEVDTDESGQYSNGSTIALVTIGGVTFRAELDPDGQTVELDIAGIWAGTGSWDGEEIESTADIGDAAYDILNSTLAAAIAGDYNDD